MSGYQIIKVPDPVLKQVSDAVSSIDGGVQKQLTDMVQTMHDGNGIGLAANQVAIANRVLVMNCDGASWGLGADEGGGVRRVEVNRSNRDAASKSVDAEADTGDNENVETNDGVKPSELSQRELGNIMMVNPEIIWQSDHKSVYEEGCLSIPGYYADVVRPAEVRVKYLDFDGKEQELEADGLLSHCVQHEIDHLNGVLFIDYISKLKRDMVIRKMKKIYGTA